MIKIGTLFSGGLAAVEWAMKYEEFCLSLTRYNYINNVKELL